MNASIWPDFLGIGAPRCGTTWLHTVLSQHPEVYVPVRRKEISYFLDEYEQGLDWYGSFFDDKQARTAKAVGEITPLYLYSDEAALRIAEFGHVKKLIVNARKPIDQFRSYYNHLARYNNTQDPEKLLEKDPHLLDSACYYKHITRFQKHFANSQILVLFLEDLGNDPQMSFRRIADFLGIDPAGFSLPDASQRVNEGGAPRFASLFYLATKSQQMLRRHNLDWLVNAVLALGIKKTLFAGKATRIDVLEKKFAARASVINEDVRDLEKLTGRDLSAWYLPDAGRNGTKQTSPVLTTSSR